MNELTLSANTLLMDDKAMERMERLANIMASGRTTVPDHLKNVGDCFAIVLQSMQWGMNPIAVAQKTFIVSGKLGYEAQLVAAVINNSGLVVDRFHFEWFGEWSRIIGKFKMVESKKKTDDHGNPQKFMMPDWNLADEKGLGVRVWATIKGETEPRELELLMTQARTRNSTLWTEDPKQQLAYLAQKRWARLHAPDVILGVYTADELQPAADKDMGPVEVVEPEPTPYPQEDFDKHLETWVKGVSAGKATAAAIAAKVASKGTPFTAEQIAALDDAIKASQATDVTPRPAPAQQEVVDADGVIHVPTADEVERQLLDATSKDAVYAAGMHIDNLPGDQQGPLNELFQRRCAEFGD